MAGWSEFGLVFEDTAPVTCMAQAALAQSIAGPRAAPRRLLHRGAVAGQVPLAQLRRAVAHPQLEPLTHQ